MFFRALAVFLLAFSVADANDKDLTALQWLEKMHFAMQSLNYQGTVIFLKNGQLDTMKYHHIVDNNVEQEQLTSLNSPLRIITHKSGEVSCLFKETSQKIINHHSIDSSFILNFPQDPVNLEQLYSLSKLSTESIAMLPAQIISIQPKDQLRYARKIWIETQHFLPLKVEVYNLDGSTLEQVVFTDLHIDSQNDAKFADVDENKLDIKHIHSKQAEPFENAPFILKNWPNGFKTVFYIRNSLQPSQKAVDHLLISDGFSSVSVYLEQKDSEGMQGLNSLGSVNSYSRVLDNYQITVLGEVPAKTVEIIAQSIILR